MATNKEVDVQSVAETADRLADVEDTAKRRRFQDKEATVCANVAKAAITEEATESCVGCGGGLHCIEANGCA